MTRLVRALIFLLAILTAVRCVTDESKIWIPENVATVSGSDESLNTFLLQVFDENTTTVSVLECVRKCGSNYYSYAAIALNQSECLCGMTFDYTPSISNTTTPVWDSNSTTTTKLELNSTMATPFDYNSTAWDLNSTVTTHFDSSTTDLNMTTHGDYTDWDSNSTMTTPGYLNYSSTTGEWDSNSNNTTNLNASFTLVDVYDISTYYVVSLECPPQKQLVTSFVPVPAINQVVVDTLFYCEITITTNSQSIGGQILFSCADETQTVNVSNIAESFLTIQTACCKFTTPTWDNPINTNFTPVNQTSLLTQTANTTFYISSVENYLASYLKIGCYLSLSFPSESNFTTNSSDMTVELCMQTCSDYSFNYVTLWNGDQCSCWDTLPIWGRSYGGCTDPCSGSIYQTCGSNDTMNVYKLTYEYMYFNCPSVTIFENELKCSFQLVAFRFSFNVSIEWGDGILDYYSNSSMYVDKRFQLKHTYSKPGVYLVKFKWVNWKNESFFPCAGCPLLSQNVTIQQVKTNPESTITTAMGSMISFSVTVYEPMQIVFNFQDKSASILITAANCNSTSPYMIIFNHTYELSGSYRISFSDYLPLSYWRIETAETGLLSTYTNLYSILTVNVGNGIQTTSENSTYLMSIQTPGCNSLDNCIGFVGIYYPFPINITIQNNCSDLIPEDSWLFINFGDNTNTSLAVLNASSSTDKVVIQVNYTYNSVGSFFINFTFYSVSEDSFNTIIMDIQTATSDFQSMSLVGCYIDQNPNRTMDSDPFLVDASTNTIESCVSNCTISHNEHAGVENGIYCYCGTGVNSPLADSEIMCNVPCSGNSKQVCGGSELMNVYQITYATFQVTCNSQYIRVNSLLVCSFQFQYYVFWYYFVIDWGDHTNQIEAGSRFSVGWQLNTTHYYNTTGELKIILNWVDGDQTRTWDLLVQNITIYELPDLVATNQTFSYKIELKVRTNSSFLSVNYGDSSMPISFTTDNYFSYPHNFTKFYAYTSPGEYDLSTFDPIFNPYTTNQVQVYAFKCLPVTILLYDKVTCEFQFSKFYEQFEFEIDWGDGSDLLYGNTSTYLPLLSFNQAHIYNILGTFNLYMKWIQGNYQLTFSIVVQEVMAFGLPEIMIVDQQFQYRIQFGIGSYLRIDYGDGSSIQVVKSNSSSDSAKNYTMNGSYAEVGDYQMKAFDDQTKLVYSSKTIRVFALNCPSGPVFNTLQCNLQFSSTYSNQSLNFSLDWGDGSSVNKTLSLNTTNSYPLSHTYKISGRYNVTIKWSNYSSTRSATILVQAINLYNWPSYQGSNESFTYTVETKEASGVIYINYADTSTEATIDTTGRICPCNFTLSHTYYVTGTLSMFITDHSTNFSVNKISVYPAGAINLNNYEQVMNLLTQSVDISNCLINCSSHGVCKYVNETLYGCYCYENYTGESCNTYTDPCQATPCLNGGICNAIIIANESTYSFNCTCPEYYSGTVCEELKTSTVCEEWSCSSNGYCYSNGTSGEINPACQCYSDYSGEHCEEESSYMKSVKITITSSTIVAFTIIASFYITFAFNDVSNLLYFNKHAPRISNPKLDVPKSKVKKPKSNVNKKMV